MDAPSLSIQKLARRLLALETAGGRDADPHGHEAVRVCEKLRASLTRFAGADGFTSLLRRALALAREEVPALKDIRLKPDGCVEDLATLPDGNDAAAALTAHLLALLVTFIGESLTMRLVRDAWPDASLDE